MLSTYDTWKLATPPHYEECGCGDHLCGDCNDLPCPIEDCPECPYLATCACSQQHAEFSDDCSCQQGETCLCHGRCFRCGVATEFCRCSRRERVDTLSAGSFGHSDCFCMSWSLLVHPGVLLHTNFWCHDGGVYLRPSTVIIVGVYGHGGINDSRIFAFAGASAGQLLYGAEYSTPEQTTLAALAAALEEAA